MSRKQMQVTITEAEFSSIEDPVNIYSPDRNILAELGHDPEETEGVRVKQIIHKPEQGAFILLVEHEEYDEVPDLAEAPRVRLKDPKLARPSRRKPRKQV